MLAGGIFRHQQHKNQRHRLAIGRIKRHRLLRADKRAHGFFYRSMAPVRNGHALPQAGGAELFAGKQAVEHIGARQAGFIFKQQTCLLEYTLFAADFQIQHNMRQR